MFLINKNKYTVKSSFRVLYILIWFFKETRYWRLYVNHYFMLTLCKFHRKIIITRKCKFLINFNCIYFKKNCLLMEVQQLWPLIYLYYFMTERYTSNWVYIYFCRGWICSKSVLVLCFVKPLTHQGSIINQIQLKSAEKQLFGCRFKGLCAWNTKEFLVSRKWFFLVNAINVTLQQSSVGWN